MWGHVDCGCNHVVYVRRKMVCERKDWTALGSFTMHAFGCFQKRDCARKLKSVDRANVQATLAALLYGVWLFCAAVGWGQCTMYHVRKRCCGSTAGGESAVPRWRRGWW